MSPPNVRILVRLDIKGPHVIKGINFEGLRVVGDPHELALKYYHEGADGLIYMDAVASLYGRNHLADIIKQTTHNIFIPLVVGGGIRSLTDVENILNSGADQIAINSASIGTPELITAISHHFGSQCMVVSIEAKQKGPQQWEAYYDSGREPSGWDVIEWAKHVEQLGAGEILLTSIDQEGTRRGFDLNLINAVSNAVSIPVIAAGGFSSPDDLIKATHQGKANAVCIGSALHYNDYSLHDIRQAAQTAGVLVRQL